MTQPNSQQIQALAAESVRATASVTSGFSGFSASIRSARRVAMSLLVDRALSA